MSEARGSTNRAVLIQTVILVLTLLGIAIAADRRVTVVEDKLSAEVATRVDQNCKHDVILEKLVAGQEFLTANQSKVEAILSIIQKQYEFEVNKGLRK